MTGNACGHFGMADDIGSNVLQQEGTTKRKVTTPLPGATIQSHGTFARAVIMVYFII